DFPATQIIINHIGLPADRSEAGIAAWRTALALVAAEPNVALKISGLGLPGRAWRIEENAPVVREAIAILGIERAMFASNYPVDSLVASFDTIFSGVKAITADRPPEERRKLFRDNAQRVYRIVLCPFRQKLRYCSGLDFRRNAPWTTDARPNRFAIARSRLWRSFRGSWTIAASGARVPISSASG